MQQNTSALRLPVELYTMPRQFEAVFNGKIYVGKIDTDPTAQINQITVYHEAENDELIPIAQPISINAGGYPVVNGQIVKLVVKGDYSIAVHDRLDAQVYYFPRCAGPYVLKVFHDQTLHGNGTEADPLGVELSKNAGNLLEVRDDGLYYGTSATDDLLNLYVDAVNGDDEHIGSKEKPLKTLKEALKRTPSNKSNNIHLHAGHSFVLEISSYIVGCTRRITVYNDPYADGNKVPEVSPENPNYYFWAAKGLSRPTIKTHVTYNDEGRYVLMDGLTVSTGGTLSLEGIIIDAVPINDEEKEGWGKMNSAPLYGDSNSSINFFGCILRSKEMTNNNYNWVVADGRSDGGIPTMNLCRCIFLQGQHFISLGENASKMLIRDSWPGENGVPYQNANLEAAAKNGKLNGILRGPNGEPRNLMINFVI